MAPPAMPHEIVFELEKASAGYNGRPVLADLDLTITSGERVAIMGRSGAGKSTLLSLLYSNRPRDVALIPQSAALVKPLSVFHNVYMGRLDRHSSFYNLRNLAWPHPREVEAVRTVLDEVGLADKLFEPAGTLSGGQQQRTSAARALFNGRPVILGDEPVSALDRVQCGEVLQRLRRQASTLVLVLHDIYLALEHTQRIVLLDHGRIVLDAPSRDLKPPDLIAHFGGAP
jgi:phosphonate transport system ATP-binding protein